MIRHLRCLPVLVLACATFCHADSSIAFNGFETGTGDWSFIVSGQTGDANGSITQTASGAGPLGLTAFDGSFYGTVHGNTNGIGPGLANGGSSFFGFDTSIPPYPGSAFSQETTVYINVNTPAPTNPSSPAFWVDNSPSSSSPSDSSSGGIGYGGEHNFRLTYTGSQVMVSADGVTPLATITTSGWYTFEFIYSKGPTGTSLAQTQLILLNSNGHQVGAAATELDNSDSDPLESQYLLGPGYTWLTNWQNNFSDDLLGIDDVAADTVGSTVPEPGEAGMLAIGLGLLVLMARRQAARLARLNPTPAIS
jgi:hypothetical protein